MAARKPLHTFFGIVLVLLGAFFAFNTARNVFHLAGIKRGLLDAWLMSELLLSALLGAFCIWVGSNELKRAGGEQVRKTRFRWGRLLAGVFIVFMSLRSHFHPDANSLKADNDAQAAGMLIATCAIALAGLALIAYAFKPRKQEAPSLVAAEKSDSTSAL